MLKGRSQRLIEDMSNESSKGNCLCCGKYQIRTSPTHVYTRIYFLVKRIRVVLKVACGKRQFAAIAFNDMCFIYRPLISGHLGPGSRCSRQGNSCIGQGFFLVLWKWVMLTLLRASAVLNLTQCFIKVQPQFFLLVQKLQCAHHGKQADIKSQPMANLQRSRDHPTSLPSQRPIVPYPLSSSHPTCLAL